MREHLSTTLEALERWSGIEGLAGAASELESDLTLLGHIEGVVAEVPEFRTKRWPNGSQLGTFRLVLYAVIRGLAPEIAIETGVLHGLTSLVILAALRRNGSGRLVSIDLPSYPSTGPVNRDGYVDTLPAGLEPGWIVGAPYATKWELRLGRSLDVLPRVLAEHTQVEFFLHDSEHTFDTMTGELVLAWQHLVAGSMLVCDNIDSNSAFADFCDRVERAPFLVSESPETPPRFGMIRR